MTLPEDFLNYISSHLPEQSEQLLHSLQQPPSLSIRINTKLIPRKSYKEHVKWNMAGVYLSQRPQFTLDPLFHAGCYYVQEAASMFVYQLLKQFVSRDAIVLDMCAAPGGKSTIIADWVAACGLLVANEYVPSRANILVENICKWGSNAVVTNADSSAFAASNLRFDAILVDAPCSGEGMFRKEPQAIEDWSIENVHNCVARGRYILDNAWQALKPGGVLFYSTCTFNEYENEEQVKYLINNLGAEYLDIQTQEDWNIYKSDYGLHFYPHLVHSEGLFVAAVRKPEGGSVKNIKLPKTLPPKRNELLDYLFAKGSYTTFVEKDVVYACLQKHYPVVLELLKSVNVIMPSLPLAQIKGKDVKPHPALALSRSLYKSNIPRCDVDIRTALEYLKMQTLQLENPPKGTFLVTYRTIPLGWAKNVGNRCNNYYSPYWRIRMEIPDVELKDIIL